MLLRLSLLFLFLACESTEQSSSGSPYVWENYAPMPEARQEIYPSLYGHKIYILGGFDTNRNDSRTLYVYDIRNDSWSLGPELPAYRHHITLTGFNGKLYAIGGYIGDNFSWTIQNTVFELDTSTQQWSQLQNMPEAQAEHVAVEVNGNIYIIGGTDDQRNATNRNQRFNPQSGVWATMAAMPTARNSAAVAVDGKRIFVMGGRYFSDPNRNIINVAAFEVYDTETDSWTILPTMIRSTGGLAGAKLNENIFAFGGEFFTGNGGVINGVWRFDLNTNIWSYERTMQTVRHGTQAVTYDGKIFVIGGADQVAFSATAVNEAFKRD